MGSINRLTDIFRKEHGSHIAEDPATTSVRAQWIDQERMMAVTTEQKIAMISCFNEGFITANTYLFTY